MSRLLFWGFEILVLLVELGFLFQYHLSVLVHVIWFFHSSLSTMLCHAIISYHTSPYTCIPLYIPFFQLFVIFTLMRLGFSDNTSITHQIRLPFSFSPSSMLLGAGVTTKCFTSNIDEEHFVKPVLL